MNRTAFCIDCDEEFDIPDNVRSPSQRCPSCRLERKRRLTLEFMRRRPKSNFDPGAPRPRITPEMQRTIDEMNAARMDDELIMNCLGREAEFSDYEDEPGGDPAEMCAGCPLLENGLCDRYARTVLRPTWGIWGGRQWVPSTSNVYRGKPLRSTLKKAA